MRLVIILDNPFMLLTEARSNPELIHAASLLSYLVLEIPWLGLPRSHTHLAFMWVSGVQTLVLTLPWYLSEGSIAVK